MPYTSLRSISSQNKLCGKLAYDVASYSSIIPFLLKEYNTGIYLDKQWGTSIILDIVHKLVATSYVKNRIWKCKQGCSNHGYIYKLIGISYNLTIILLYIQPHTSLYILGGRI